MSNIVLAPSATMLTVSNAKNPEWNEELFYLTAKKSAERTAKGMTRERQMLKRNSLVSAVCADYRAHFTGLYGKTDRLPASIFAEIDKAVDKVIAEQLAQVGQHNVISLRRAFHVKVNDLEVTERVNITGENALALKEQRLGAILAIGQAEERLKRLEAKPTPNLDQEKALRINIIKLNNVLSFIEGELKEQSKVTEEAKP